MLSWTRVIFAEANLLALQFLLHERVAIEPAGGVKRKEACHAHNDGSEHLVPDVEVVVREAALPIGTCTMGAVFAIFCRSLRTRK